MSPHRFVMLLLLLVGSVVPAWSQGAPTPLATFRSQGIPDAQAAFQQKQIRELEQRSVTQPVGPEIQQQRRDLIRDNHGVAFDSNGLILQRQLDRIPSGPQVPPPEGPVARLTPQPELPSSLGNTRDGLPNSFESPGELPSIGALRGTAPGSSGDTVTTANRLISRAEQALNAGKPDQARSDAEFAQRLLAGFENLSPANAAYPRISTARERLDVLRDRLSSSD